MPKAQLDESTKIRVIRSILDGESSVTSSARVLGVGRASIHRWINRFEKKGAVPRFHSESVGRPTAIDLSAGRKLLKMIRQPASRFGYESDFWTRRRIMQTAKSEFGLKLSKSGLLRFFVKFEQSYKKPETRYYESNTKEQKLWQKNEVPKIKAVVMKYKAILYFEDEANISLSPVVGKTWGPIGEKIIRKITGARGSVSAISAISSSGDLIFNVHSSGKRYNSDSIIRFLSQMLKHHHRRHLVVVMDQAPCHKSKKVKEFVRTQKRLHVFYLPPRSPEFNPDEKVWRHLKNEELRDHQATNVDDLKSLTKKKLASMSNNRKKLIGIYKMSDGAVLFGQ